MSSRGSVRLLRRAGFVQKADIFTITGEFSRLQSTLKHGYGKVLRFYGEALEDIVLQWQTTFAEDGSG